MSMVQQAIEVSAPLHTVYEQLAAFENYPRFMSGVREVTPIGDDRTHWIIDVDGKCREFDAQIIERSVDERVSWSTMEGPLLAETLTLRPLGETRTQVVAQLEADLAFLMPSGRHGQASLTRRLKEDLATFKNLVESGVLGGGVKLAGGLAHKATAAQTSSKRPSAGASADQLSDRSTKIFGGGTPDPASVAARIRNRNPHPGAGWGPARLSWATPARPISAIRGTPTSPSTPMWTKSGPDAGSSSRVRSAVGWPARPRWAGARRAGTSGATA